MQKNNSYISENAKIHPSVKIGPFCYIGKNVEIGENCELKSHVSIIGNTLIGKNNMKEVFLLLVITILLEKMLLPILAQKVEGLKQ